MVLRNRLNSNDGQGKTVIVVDLILPNGLLHFDILTQSHKMRTHI